MVSIFSVNEFAKSYPQLRQVKYPQPKFSFSHDNMLFRDKFFFWKKLTEKIKIWYADGELFSRMFKVSMSLKIDF